jgi:ABC-type uncharacterized transport system substrate-binding protein
MNKKLFWIVMLFLLSAGTFSEAQRPTKIPRIGFLIGTSASAAVARTEAFRDGLRNLGYVEGKNILVEYRYGEGKLDRLPSLVAELVQFKVEGLARPGGNVTGITRLSRDLGGKRLEVLKEAVPKVARVAALYEPASPASVIELKDVLSVAAPTLGLTVRPWEVGAAEDFEKVFAALNKQRPDGLYVAGGALINANHKRTVGFALKSRLPSIYISRVAVDAAGLMSYGADLAHSHRRVAYYVDRILKEAKPADLPVEQPTKFEFVINLKTAKQIGLTIPPNVLARADKVIK